MKRPAVIRAAIFVVVVAATWGVLSLGTGVTNPDLEVGALASQDYLARQPAEVIDTVATEAEATEAMNDVPPVRETNIEVENQVRDQINALFDDVAASRCGRPAGDHSHDLAPDHHDYHHGTGRR